MVKHNNVSSKYIKIISIVSSCPIAQKLRHLDDPSD